MSVNSDWRWVPTLADDLFFCAWARTVLNSAVLSCIEVATIVGQREKGTRVGGKKLWRETGLIYVYWAVQEVRMS